MISSEPDPERSSIPALPRPIVSVNWTPEARREYSRLMAMSASPLPTRAALNALTRRAIFQALQDAPGKRETFSDIGNSRFSLDVSFVSDAEIFALNSRHRSKNKATDVLSFSQMEGEWMPSGEEILLGDLIISIETAARQAQELKHDLTHEVAFLVAHGVLHLLGYDHDTSARRRAMFALQDKIVANMESRKPVGRKSPSRQRFISSA